jgi:hypothetical protein
MKILLLDLWSHRGLPARDFAALTGLSPTRSTCGSLDGEGKVVFESELP